MTHAAAGFRVPLAHATELTVQERVQCPRSKDGSKRIRARADLRDGEDEGCEDGMNYENGSQSGSSSDDNPMLDEQPPETMEDDIKEWWTGEAIAEWVLECWRAMPSSDPIRALAAAKERARKAAPSGDRCLIENIPQERGVEAVHVFAREYSMDDDLVSS